MAAASPDLSGGFTSSDPAVTGSMTMDLGTGTGSGSLQPSVPFTHGFWTAHSIVLTAIGPGTVHADMMIDWIDISPNTGINGPLPVTAEFGMTPTAPCSGMGCYAVGNTFTMITLDGIVAGVPGNPMTTGPFQGFNAAFNGTLTVTASTVPVPAAVWLFGSGLMGLLGLARRRVVVATQRGACVS